MLNVELKFLHENFKNSTWELPFYATEGSAAFDLIAAIDHQLLIRPFSTELISSGLSVWIKDPNYTLIMAPRSGVGCKMGLILGNTVGIIDSDYQGELKMCCYNRTGNGVFVNPGDRIFQAMLIKKEHCNFQIVDEFSNQTSRGEGGFGHSGI